jgi:predicted MPP superfamily phosphohydrolase
VPLIVSNGVGAVTLPLRFLARPEVHLITLSR